MIESITAAATEISCRRIILESEGNSNFALQVG